MLALTRGSIRALPRISFPLNESVGVSWLAKLASGTCHSFANKRRSGDDLLKDEVEALKRGECLDIGAPVLALLEADRALERLSGHLAADTIAKFER